MAEKQKPQEDIVKLAGRAMTHPEKITHEEIKRMAARLLDDQRNDPEPNAKSRAGAALDAIKKAQAEPRINPLEKK